MQRNVFSHVAWIRPVQPSSMQDLDALVCFGDEPVSAGASCHGVCQTLSALDDSAVAAPLTAPSIISPTSKRSDDEFDLVLKHGLQDLSKRLLQQHRRTVDTLRNELKYQRIYAAPGEDQHAVSRTSPNVEGKQFETKLSPGHSTMGASMPSLGSARRQGSARSEPAMRNSRISCDHLPKTSYCGNANSIDTPVEMMSWVNSTAGTSSPSHSARPPHSVLEENTKRNSLITCGTLSKTSTMREATSGDTHVSPHHIGSRVSISSMPSAASCKSALKSTASYKLAPGDIRRVVFTEEAPGKHEDHSAATHMLSDASYSQCAQGTQRLKKDRFKIVHYQIREEWVQTFKDPHLLDRSLSSAESSTSNHLDGRFEQLRATPGASDKKKFWFMLDPGSMFCIIWVMASLVLVSYDCIMVPIDVCFRREFNHGNAARIQVFARIFWTVDIALRFFTGVLVNGLLEMHPKAVALLYVKGWFVFDFAIVVSEWMILLFDLGPAQAISLMRGIHWLRLLRMLRLLRILRVARLKVHLHDIAVLSSRDLDMTKKLFKAIGLLIVFTHFIACTWHLVGDILDAGWVSANGLKDADVLHRYMVSLHWTVARLQGSTDSRSSATRGLDRQQTPTTEVAADSVALLFCFFTSAWFMATVVEVVLALATSQTTQTYKLAKHFMNRHKVSRISSQKTMKFLQANQIQGPGEIMMDEARLLRVLPSHLQGELLYEVRAPLLCMSTVFNNLHSVSPRCVRNLCAEALMDLLAVEGEVVFGCGDVCTKAYVVRSGRFKYAASGSEDVAFQQKGSVETRYTGSVREGGPYIKIHHGQLISEAVLWTAWEHAGELTAATDGLLITIVVQAFSSIVFQHKMACIFACKYARHFTWKLHHEDHVEPSDLTGYELSLATLDQNFGAGHDHLIFISHYKVEAGTEASLMRDLLEPMIRLDSSNEASYLRSPIFTDSEDLADLAKLKKHVEGSDNLVVLLTPNILTRPWCLFEIVTAVRHGVQLVPVEVQRPGMKYQYPDEEFYARLRSGQVVAPKDMQILNHERCSPQEIEDAIHLLFMKIALPFSPHRSGNVRQAELTDILKRCSASVQEFDRIATEASTNRLVSDFSSFNSGKRESIGPTSREDDDSDSEFSMNLSMTL